MRVLFRDYDLAPFSEGRPPRWLTDSVFGAAGCSSTSAVRCELSRPETAGKLASVIRVDVGIGLSP